MKASSRESSQQCHGSWEETLPVEISSYNTKVMRTVRLHGLRMVGLNFVGLNCCNYGMYLIRTFAREIATEQQRALRRFVYAKWEIVYHTQCCIEALKSSKTGNSFSRDIAETLTVSF